LALRTLLLASMGGCAAGAALGQGFASGDSLTMNWHPGIDRNSAAVSPLVAAPKAAEKEGRAAPGDSAAGELREAAGPAALRPPLVELAAKMPKQMYGAYADARSILSEDNSCSQFFGGPAAATYVLDRFAALMQNEAIPNPAVGIRMFGETSFETDMRTGFSFRLFEKVTVNKNGPFYKEWTFQRAGYPMKTVPVPNCGSLPPNTREVRVSMVLHELAHLIKGPDGNWLIPNDGGSAEQSRQNSLTIEGRCMNQIMTLGKKPEAARSLPQR
ncbi:MAG: hypothetical protein ACRD68_14355, partial [Pyrinomonadaceae bacterium]